MRESEFYQVWNQQGHRFIQKGKGGWYQQRIPIPQNQKMLWVSYWCVPSPGLVWLSSGALLTLSALPLPWPWMIHLPFAFFPTAWCCTEPIFPSSSPSALAILHIVSSLTLVFKEKNWLRLCRNNSRSKRITEINYIENQRFISWLAPLVISPLQRNEQGEEYMGKPEWFMQAKFAVQQGLWRIVAF